MKIEEHLDALRSSVSGCDLTAFGDLSSGLVLRSSSGTPCPREVLDALCDKAATGFSMVDQSAGASVIDPEIYGASIVVFGADNTRVFTRALENSTDFICASVAKAQTTDETLHRCLDVTSVLRDDAS